MATTQLTLLFLGTLATLATIGMFLDMDEPTAIVVSVFAALPWAIMANASLDVITNASLGVEASEPVWSLVYVGAIMAFATAAFAVFNVFAILGNRSGATDASPLSDQ